MKGEILEVKRFKTSDPYFLARISGIENMVRIEDEQMGFLVDPDSKSLEIETDSVVVGRPAQLFNPTIIGTESVIGGLMVSLGFSPVPMCSKD